MTLIATELSAQAMRRERPQAAPGAALVALGTATPELTCTQDEFAAIIESELNLQGMALQRWRRIIAGTGIDIRQGVARPEHVLHLSTAERMRLYEQSAPALAHQAARQALTRARVRPEDVTDLILVSCTGFSAPGVDAALIESLALPTTVRRTIVGFMGCFGAMPGLRAAVGACAIASPDGRRPVALVVCVELCSLHMRADDNVQNLVASALFADGAAAAVVIGTETQHGRSMDEGESAPVFDALGALTIGANLLVPEGRGWMTWRITDAGFVMTLAREVPAALRERLPGFVNQSALRAPRTYIVHPGGPGILDAVDEALHLGGESGLEHSRQILRQFGNMSSATVLFVLDEALRHHAPLPATLLSFGPGLTIECLQLLPMR